MDSTRTRRLTAIIEREDDGYVALCPELDIASQGATVEEARRNLVEALELFLETADRSEIEGRLRGEIFVTQLEVNVTVTVPVPDHPELRIGTLQSIIRQSGLPRATFEAP